MTPIPQTTLGERLLTAATATLELFSAYLGDPAEVVRRAVQAVPDDGPEHQAVAGLSPSTIWP
jgi:hypothetical protein